MKKRVINIAFLVFVILTMILSIWGPKALTYYKDRTILNQIHAETMEAMGEGYRYALTVNEKLYIVSKCMNSQMPPETEQNALTRTESAKLEFQNLEGTYAFVLNHKGPTGKEITDAQIFETCNQQMEKLKELEILPESVKEVEPASYTAVLYSAIDVLDPRNNVGVWKISLSTSQKNANKENRLIDAYIDADSGKIYSFYVRSPKLWEEMEADKMIEKWSSYMGLSSPIPYESENPLSETTTYFKKYEFVGMQEEKTIVTIGFYEGINELFLKIAK